MQTRKRKLTTHSPRLDTIIQGEELATFSDNHDDDPSYNPANKKQRGHVKGSRKSLPESVKLELKNTALQQRCTLTLDPIYKSCTVEIAHVVEATTHATRLRDFQQAWYTKDFPDVDSPLNLMYLRVDWHRLFDRNQWAILPATELLVDILAASVLNKAHVRLNKGVDLFSKFLKDPNAPRRVPPRFEYQFIWLGGSDPKIYPSLSRRKYPPMANPDTSVVSGAVSEPPSALIESHTRTASLNNESRDVLHAKLAAQQENGTLRAQIGVVPAQVSNCLQEEHEDPTQDSTATNEVNKLLLFAQHYDVFLPPYADFPSFESHVHPFFVIVNAGDKLSKVDNPAQFGPEAEILLDIYRLWFNLPSPPAPAPAAASDGGDGDGDDQSSCTSQTEDDGSSFESGSRAIGSHNPVDAPQQSGGAYNTQNRATNNEPAPCDVDDVPMLEPCISSAGTPSLVHDSSINGLGFHINKDEELEDVDTLVSKWLSKAGAEPLDEMDRDRELNEYRKEPPQHVEPQRWQEWASTPPKIPYILKSYHDTSRLTSYHWSLYHESVNLMAPTGSHRIPRHLTMVDDPDVDREYDMYDLGAMV
ncbi:hypothetical protein EYR38_002305 [Pleurotus pulmonarius]|nr:hypothetical protein EYR38_002305 [Pleurotus pulmonarius]